MRWKRASCFEFMGISMKTETKTWSKFTNGQRGIIEQILESEERKKSKRAGVQESQSGNQVGKLTIWESSFQIKKLKQSSTGLSVPPE